MKVMNVVLPKFRRGTSALVPVLIASSLLGLGGVSRAGEISDVTVVNVTPSSFSVVWRATNATPSIAVFADPGGATNLAGQLGFEAFPLNTGNPDLPAGYQRRLDAAVLRQQTQGLGWMMMRVSDCRPNTTYYFQLAATPAVGAPDIYPDSGPLPSVTTAMTNAFVINDQALIINAPDSVGPGSLLLLSHTNAAYPLAAVVGDGVGTNQAFFNVSDLFTLADTGNFTPLGEQSFTLSILDANPSVLSQTYTLTFTTDFATALTSLTSVNTEFLALDVGAAVLPAGQTNRVPITIEASTNLTAIDLTLQIPPGRLTNLVLQTFASPLDPVASTVTQQNATTWLLHFTTQSGQTISGSNLLAELAFTAVPDQTSAFVPLQVSTVTGTKTDALPISRTFAQSGRVVIIASQPLLEAGFAVDGSRQLTLYGKAWTSYAIEYSTNLANPAGWTQEQHFAQTNMVTVLAGLGAASPNAFYRAVEFTPDPPVLEALRSPNGMRTLLGYGRPGSQYTVLSTTNLSNLVPWTPVQTYTLTNSFQYLQPTGGENVIFYRLRRN